MKFIYNQNVKFRLDGRWEGEGKVKSILDHQIEVELTKPCKEFNEGLSILVDYSEVVEN